ncbi:MAG: hypothetical protein PHI67_08755 [Candidatus Methanomethylophilaceae archaeon]|jgi:hypothetical protein|nr:hypothetical protein [Candidatus Methanomethylophilaceae archaeon]
MTSDTGENMLEQLDVRAAANFPGEVGEPEPLDDVDALPEDELSAEGADTEPEEAET